MIKTRFAVFCAGALAATAHAGPRTSVNYSITTDIMDTGGAPVASAAYTNAGSTGGVVGISTVASPVEIAKHGYIGQLYDLASGIFLAPAPATINEGGTLQLVAARNLDDGTGLTLDPTTAVWSIFNGPNTSISTSGIATAGTVYQDTTATVQGVANGFTAFLSLTVLNVNNDDLPGYAHDGIDDAWQVQYFGAPPNANAGPNVDFDGTGQTNLFKFIAGLNPLDPNSRFTLTIASVSGQPGQKILTFSPRLSGRTYTVMARTNLGALGGWFPINGSTPNDNGQERTVTDLNAAGPSKFYRVDITKP